MSRYFSESYFQNYRYRLNEAQQREFSDHIADSAADTTFDIFLSYNFEDREIVRGVYLWLRNKGFKAYLDFEVDPELDRRNVTKETALLIQSRLKHSKSLIYAQSPHANMSKWMPWELGYVDGHTGKCAILPITPGGVTPAPRQEYLLLYPLIKINENNQERVYTDNAFLYGISLDTYLQ